MSLEKVAIDAEFRKLRQDVEIAKRIRFMAKDMSEKEAALVRELEAKRKLRRATMGRRIDELKGRNVRVAAMENELGYGEV